MENPSETEEISSSVGRDKYRIFSIRFHQLSQFHHERCDHKFHRAREKRPHSCNLATCPSYSTHSRCVGWNLPRQQTWSSLDRNPRVCRLHRNWLLHWWLLRPSNNQHLAYSFIRGTLRIHASFWTYGTWCNDRVDVCREFPYSY